MKPIYYVGDYMIRYYDKDDTHLSTEHYNGSGQEAIAHANERMTKDTQGYIRSFKVLRVIHDSKYNVHIPRTHPTHK